MTESPGSAPASAAAPVPAGKTMRVRLLSPARAAFDGPVLSAVLPAFDGEWGVLPNHAPMVAALAVGCLRLTKPDGSWTTFAVRGGFAEVRDNVVTVLSPECLGPEEISQADVEAELTCIEGGERGKATGACLDRAARQAWAKACRLAMSGAQAKGQA